MANGDNETPFSGFIKNYQIQRADRFLVTIDTADKMVSPPRLSTQKVMMDNRSGIPPKIKNYYIENITIPTWDFKKEIAQKGLFVYSFPVIQHEGFEFSLLFNENDKGDIGKFVAWCQSRILDENGIYFSPDLSTIGEIIVSLVDNQDKPLIRYTFKNCYFLRQTPLTFDYTTGSPLKVSITFGADEMQYENLRG